MTDQAIMSKKAAGSSPKRRGRPPGSKNRDIPAVELYPPECPQCGGLLSKDGSKLKDNQSRNICQELGPLRMRDGNLYKKVQKTLRECISCGQICTVFEARIKVSE